MKQSEYNTWIDQYIHNDLPQVIKQHYAAYKDTDWTSGDIAKLVISLSLRDSISSAYFAGWNDRNNDSA